MTRIPIDNQQQLLHERSNLIELMLRWNLVTKVYPWGTLCNTIRPTDTILIQFTQIRGLKYQSLLVASRDSSDEYNADTLERVVRGLWHVTE